MGVGPHGSRGWGPANKQKKKTSTVRIASLPCFCCSLLTSLTGSAQEPPPLTPQTLEAALAAKPQGAEAEGWPNGSGAYFGAEALLKGAAAPKIDEVTVAWAVELPQLRRNAGPARRLRRGALHDAAGKVGSGDCTPASPTCRTATAFTWHFEAARSPSRRRAAGSLRDAPRQPREAGRAEGHDEADAAVGEQDLRRHAARLVGLRPGAVHAPRRLPR